MKSRTFVDRCLSPFREFGPGAGLVYVAGRVLRSLSPSLDLLYYEFMAQPIPEVAVVPERVVRDIELRKIERGAPEVGRMPAREDIKESRFDQGAVCYGAYRRDEWLGFIWLAFGRYEEDEVRCTFEPRPAGQAVFDFDFYIFPEHRLGRAFVAMWARVNELLRERGVRWTFSRITRFNVASRNAHARMGARRVGRALFLKAGSFEAMLSSVPPYVSVSLRRRVPVVLEVRG
jgi:hypothetical protein